MPSADLSAVNNFSAVPQTGAFIANVPSKEKIWHKVYTPQDKASFGVPLNVEKQFAPQYKGHAIGLETFDDVSK